MIGDVGVVLDVRLDRLRTGLEELRGRGGRRGHASGLAEMPVRITPVGDGTFELVDGFKRVRHARALGELTVRALVERPCSSVERKHMLLRANAPQRTITAMDEARVVAAMRRDDGAGTKMIARVLGKKPEWVAKRLLLAERLAPRLGRCVDEGALGVTLALALAGLDAEAQLAVYEAIATHRLKGHEGIALIGAYRAASTVAERSELLRQPLDRLRPERRRSSPLGSLATRLTGALETIRQSLHTLASFALPELGLTPAERRRLEAERAEVVHLLVKTARALSGQRPKETLDADRAGGTERSPERTRRAVEGDLAGGARSGAGAAARGLRHAQDRSRLGRNRKTIQRVLAEHATAPPSPRQACPPAALSKLDPFRELIQQKVKLELTTTRILREIREAGYAGGRSILATLCRSLRADIGSRSRKGVKRRFETPPAKEAQIDWSPYVVKLGGRPTTVHAFSMAMCYSRKKHMRFYPNEQESILLEAHVHAYADFGGAAYRQVYDRMATVVLGQIGRDGKVIWHPRFLEFMDCYGFDAFLCERRDPDRKGKVERPFRHLEVDFLRGAEFASLQDLNERLRWWLDHVANGKPHGTTGQVPDEAFLAERDLLIRLPDVAYLTCDEQPRQVDIDSTLSVAGTSYSVPCELANRTVTVRLYAEEFHVLDGSGRVVMQRRYVAPAEKGKLQIDPAHYEGLGRRAPAVSSGELDDAFVRRFPALVALLEGIKRRMKSIAHIHVRTLLRLAARYGEAAFIEAASRAQAYRRFDAHAVRRILERSFPLPDEEPLHSLTATARVTVLLGDVDGGSLEGFADLDSRPADVSEPGPGAEPQEGDPEAEDCNGTEA